MTGLLISIDVGGTLGYVDEPSLAATLMAASPLDADDARRLLRTVLHTCPSIDSKAAAEICEKLHVPLAVFPQSFMPPTLRLLPGALEALQAMNRYATIVTLSNVSCLDANTNQLRALLHPWVHDHFQSCRIGYAKPDPLAFRHVADACGFSTASMIHIGDDWICDVDGAHLAGVTALWLSYGRRVPEPERLRDHTVLVADDIVSAGHLISELARRRQL